MGGEMKRIRPLVPPEAEQWIDEKTDELLAAIRDHHHYRPAMLKRAIHATLTDAYTLSLLRLDRPKKKPRHGKVGLKGSKR
jgi:hypothetical protein